MTKITFRSPNCKNGKSITLKGFKLDNSKVYCNQCGVELTQKEIEPSVIAVYKKDKEGKKDINTARYISVYLCFSCIEKLIGRRPDHE